MESADFHILHCGQGDTILLRIAPESWLLVDCNLASEAAIEAFLTKAAALGIERLEAVILTHPDRDHYRGMRQVIEHYASGSRSIGAFYDTGFTPKLARAAANAGKSLDRELLLLFQSVVRLHTIHKLTYKSLYRGWKPEQSEPEPWKRLLIPLSPTVSDIHFANLESMVGTAERGANEYSLVFLVDVRGQSENLLALFTGDAGGDTLRRALQNVPEFADGVKIDFAKIAHHGSWRSHLGSPICTAIRTPGRSIAVVSTCSRSTELPRREVLRAYLGSRWRVYDTGRRGESENVGLVHAVAWRESVEGKHDIVAAWNERDGIVATPSAAEVIAEHLHLYPSGAAQD